MYDNSSLLKDNAEGEEATEPGKEFHKVMALEKKW